ncbi:mitochondrial sodium/hydrogen exchanger 9b2-like [Plakobranchus ocellatus]|uniref:Mitochondrial sodium/hydrogen exchanger 9b2-like n=1 Tax=Plakobranchus ocellatus TaxID=259542 RepID=A0AAV3ZQR8_9GAST|nr:mitochondrial sodium/hydrogen exchanger 9b2-like [Plakobranchus ocellatus]
MSSEKVEMEMIDGGDATDQGCCHRTRMSCHSCVRPCLAESHPLPPNASCCRRLLDNLLCPPHSRAGAVLFIVIFSVVAWTTLLAVTGDSALPGGNLFSLAVLFVACWCAGYIIGLIRLPPLLGMLIIGGVLGNAPHINFANDIHPSWSSGCRQIALTIILIRAGLGLDPKALRRLSFVVLRLAFLPCLVETLVGGISCHLILGFPWPWGFMLGFIIAAVSPAVVVPSLLGLSERGYGLDKGIPTLVIAAASVDDVLAITGFGVLLGISFSSGNILWTLAKGPLEALVGIVAGIVGGFILWYIPQRTSKHQLLFRSSLLLCMGLMFIFGSQKIDWAGAGPLAALTLPFVAALRWRAECEEGAKNPVEDVVGVLWMVFQPLLFGLIGAEVKIESLDGNIVGLGVAVLGIGLTFRAAVSYLAVMGTDLNFKERLFIPIAWLPKATVQAAIGAVALDRAKDVGDEDLIKLGEQVLMLAVLVILITAPIGAIGIALAGPRLLKRQPQRQTIEEVSKRNSAENLENGEKEPETEQDGLIHRGSKEQEL